MEDDMKIIIINGSPRKNGATAYILNIISAYLKTKSDVTVHFYNLLELDMHACVGCCHCFEHGCCIYNDDAERLSNSISNADGIIIGTPTYASNVPGLLKTFIDRGHLIIEQLLKGKYALGVVTSENYGGSTAAAILKNVFIYAGAHVSSIIKHKLPFSSKPQFSKQQEALFQMKAEHFYQNIRNHKVSFFQQTRHSIIFNFGIKPFVLKKGETYQGVLDKWNAQKYNN